MTYGLSNGHVTAKGQTCDPNTLTAQYLENKWRCCLATIAIPIVCCIGMCSTVGYPRDSLASCFAYDDSTYAKFTSLPDHVQIWFTLVNPFLLKFCPKLSK